MRALIVDDNTCLCKLFAALLEDAGFEADGAPDGRTAFSMLYEKDYDVIISDMHMPVLDGEGLYRLIAAHLPHLTKRMVFATADSFDDEHAAFFKETACPVLIKPFPLAEFKSVVMAVSGGHYEAAPSGTPLEMV